jgi:hypothetical protein
MGEWAMGEEGAVAIAFLAATVLGGPWVIALFALSRAKRAEERLAALEASVAAGLPG